MNRWEFDKFADEYRQTLAEKVAGSGEAPEFFAEYKIADVATFSLSAGVRPTKVLDFGSGVGSSIPYFKKYFPEAKLACADVSSKSLEIAAARFPDQASFARIEGEKLPFEDGSFDIIFSACVFHHIPHEEHSIWLNECLRVAMPGAILAVFEHNPLNPLTVKVVNSCPFDENARLITARSFKQRIARAGWSKPERRYRIFFPKILAPLRPLERLLVNIPLGAQYVIYARA